MLKDLIFEYLAGLGQKQLFFGVEELSPTQQERFFAQIKKYDSTLLKKQREALFHTRKLPTPLEPISLFDRSGSEENQAAGKELLNRGKVGCLILAGGFGSRLGAKQPKGTVPVTPIKGKSLFQLFLEKAAFAAKQSGQPLPVAIMTSPFNHLDTLTFLEKHRYFGTKESSCSLFLQGALPYLDEAGNWLLEAPGMLAEAADGNGAAVVNFFNAGIWQKWKEKGIEYVTIIPIDNALADPFDVELIGYHHLSKADATLKAVMRRDANESVGTVARSRDQLCIIEYTELPENEKKALSPDGMLLWRVANTGLFCFRMDFIENLAKNPHFYLPWHIAKKSAEIFAPPNGRERIKVYKCETFFFDVLDFTSRANVIVYPREEIYSPLKNAAGEGSLETVQAAFLANERRILQKILGKEVGDGPFELSPVFHYPTPELIAIWRNKEPPQPGYVEA